MEERTLPGLQAAQPPRRGADHRGLFGGVNSRRVRRALSKLFEGHVGKDIVSRAWQGTRAAWRAWPTRDLADQDIVQKMLDGTVVKVRLDRQAAASRC